MRTIMSTNGRIVLPAKIRRKDRIKPGQRFEIQRIAPGEYRLTMEQPLHNVGLIDSLLACPVKGYFVPIESESF